MSYTKTQWVNNTTPINDTNLNKIEQGIYDNSLVVDSVNSTVKPSESALANAVEITEGQMTNVLGISNIEIKGDTGQDGTPTPSAPIDVNIVSGSNITYISNKNLLNLPNGIYSHNGVTANIHNGIMTLNGTASGTSAIDIPINIKVKANQNYTLQANNTSTIGQSGSGTTYACIRFRLSTTDDGTTDVRFNPTNNYKTFQKTEDTTYAYLRIRTGDGLTYNNYIIKPQLEKSSSITTYTSHQGRELHLNLGNIELYKIGNYQDYFYRNNNTGKWYLHKEITFETRTSEDNWQTDSMPQSNPRRYIRNASHIYIVPANNDTIVTAICNYPLVSATNTSTGTPSGVAIHPNGSFYISADVYNNLTSAPIKIYIPLITPTDTEITDTTLKSQLEAIYNAPLYEQTNITQFNNDLPAILNITACKDNINGIKAFIRK